MPKYQVLLSVIGTASFYLEAESERDAEQAAEQMVDAGEWTAVMENYEYEVAEVYEVKPD
jgi:phosphoribosylformylglycinamidine (FGAM) synthase PurS component